jgi:hypothetical protein
VTAPLDVAYRWVVLWSRMEDRAMEHCASLDPRTDQLAIIRWHGRWLRSRAKARAAVVRFNLASIGPRPRILN